MEAQLIKLLLEQDNYKEFSPYIKKDLFSSVDGSDKRKWFWHIFLTMQKFYDKHDEPLTLEALKQLHIASVQGSSVQIKEQHETALKELSEVSSTSTAKELLNTLQLNSMRSDAQDLLDDDDFEAVKELLAKMEDISNEDDEWDCLSLADMEDQMEADCKWQWITPSLNQKVKGFGDERTALIFARPDGGKTSFTVANEVHFLNQGAKVLHFCISEDTTIKLLERYYQAAFSINDAELEQNRAKYAQMFKERYAGKLFIKNVATLTLAQARKYIKKCNPDIVTYDQYQKLECGVPKHLGTMDAVLAHKVQKVKEMAKEYGHGVMCVTQAGADGEKTTKEGKRPKKYLDMSDVYGSNTLVQGEFQIIFGIGQDGGSISTQFDPDDTNKQINVLTRYINLCKNKGAYGNCTMYLEPTICKWYEPKEN